MNFFVDLRFFTLQIFTLVVFVTTILKYFTLLALKHVSIGFMKLKTLQNKRVDTNTKLCFLELFI